MQIAAGHHRVKAPIEAGITIADVFVADDMDDAQLVRIYARENATQHGNTGTAQAGTLASILHLVAKAALTGWCIRASGHGAGPSDADGPDARRPADVGAHGRAHVALPLRARGTRSWRIASA
jgi:hypothetical protein